MPAKDVKAYLKRNKNDAADATAICEAVRRPTLEVAAWIPVGGRRRAGGNRDATAGRRMVAGEPQLSLSRLLEIAQIGRRLILAGRHQVAVAAHEIV